MAISTSCAAEISAAKAKEAPFKRAFACQRMQGIPGAVVVTTYKGYELHSVKDGKMTTSCKAVLPKIGVSRDLGSIAAAKRWITARDKLPLEQREPLNLFVRYSGAPA